jgi:inosine-uridine nucleoside N-ribohydrolase
MQPYSARLPAPTLSSMSCLGSSHATVAVMAQPTRAVEGKREATVDVKTSHEMTRGTRRVGAVSGEIPLLLSSSSLIKNKHSESLLSDIPRDSELIS